MNQHRISSIAAMFLIALATVFSTFAQQPPRQPTPNDTLVSTETHSDNRVTFRIYAPKATEVTLRGDWMEGPGPVKLEKDDKGVWSAHRRPAHARLLQLLRSPSTASARSTRRTRRSSRASPAWTACSSLPGAEADVRGQQAGAARRGPQGLVPVRARSDAAAHARLHAARLRRRQATGTRSSTCCTAAATRTPAGARSAAPGFILDNLIAAKKARPMIVVMPNGSLPRPARRHAGSAARPGGDGSASRTASPTSC